MAESIGWLLRDMRKARSGGAGAVARRQRDRLARVVSHARAHSPYYRELYRGLPEAVYDTKLLPVTDKRKLMADFDNWCTDRRVTLERARSFIDDPTQVGRPFLDRYRVGTSSGSSGIRGIFLFDDRSTAVTSAMALRGFGRWLRWRDASRIVGSGARVASILATGGHFGSSTVLPRRGDGSRIGERRLRVFSVFSPLPQLVAELNDFRPAVLIGYAGQLALLAGEQEAGRLRIRPTLVVLGAEGLSQPGYERIASVFRARIGNGYGACEFMSTAASCPQNWLHVNSDWVIVEPVDRDHRPVAPGEASHTVLITNLANEIQPILRYDLGDSLFVRPDPCPCGDPFPAIRARGRASEALVFDDGRGNQVPVAPVALAGVIDRAPGLELAQVHQTSPSQLSVRLRATHHADLEELWRVVYAEIQTFLHAHQLDGISVTRSDEAPEQSTGGKYRLIIPFAGAPDRSELARAQESEFR
ncbi:phenylacetate--CoA ligase family protein [Micromonospora sp. ALFpr18c]|uniref:phenylacetate--CoA ligase family protein n=1 Tax=unclassified Micromonospora TaxID=2617518 RepID=UPI00124B5289|nr:phenylacetate--CoA ligase family protein [Micromonospora sp. ALFpr18c]KAB1933869.1 phenylacetate--CoA ligase family protein [Micromonospora sp. ALFpr18c]